MALWDSADLLARCKRLAARPATDEDKGPTDSTADDMWYALLTEAQQEYYNRFAAHFPWVLYTAPTKLTTADNGLTYTFPSSVTPMKVELYRSKAGEMMWPGGYFDGAKDYVWEGNRIRFPWGRTVTFGDGPYARYIVPPGVIASATQPTLAPDWTRLLLVYHAVKIWAERGGLRDPQPFARLENEMWFNPEQGTGVLVTLKTQQPYSGLGAIPTPYVGLAI